MDKTYIKHSIGEVDGCGVIVGTYFITAAHILELGDFIFIHEGVTYRLAKKDAVIFKTMDIENNPDPEGCDLAVFRLHDILSPLKFSLTEPKKDDKYISVSYHHEGGAEESYTEIEGEAIVKTVDGNFFSCAMEKALKEGSSGSPIFDADGAVAGILCAGNYENSTCVFLLGYRIYGQIATILSVNLEKSQNEFAVLKELGDKLSEIHDKHNHEISGTRATNIDKSTYGNLPINLNLRDIFVVLTQFGIEEDNLHEFVMKFDDSGYYYDELLGHIASKDYTSFKRLVIEKDISTGTIQCCLVDYLLGVQNQHLRNMFENTPEKSLEFITCIFQQVKGFTPNEIEVLQKLAYASLNPNVDFDNQLKDLLMEMEVVGQAFLKLSYFGVKRQLDNNLLVYPEYREIIFDKKYATYIKNAELAEPLSIEMPLANFNDPMTILVLNSIRTLIKQKDQELKEIEAASATTAISSPAEQLEKENNSDDKIEVATSSFDYREIFASQAPDVDGVVMRDIAAKLAGQVKSGGSITYSTDAYIKPSDISRFCYFFLNKNCKMEVNVDFSYPIQWLGGWISLKYFISKLYGDDRSLPSNLAMAVAEVFRFKLQRNRQSEKGKISMKTFNNAKNINGAVKDEDRKRINKIFKECGLK